jgi:beta-glucosidase
MDLLAQAGLTDYRFSIEWARIEPERGFILRAELDHYRRMIEGAFGRGLRPMVTLHHFTHPGWFAVDGGWNAPDAIESFGRYVETIVPILDGVEYVCTINEPNILATMHSLGDEGGDALENGLPAPDPAWSDALVAAHERAREILKAARPDLQVGWSIAVQDYQPAPEAESAVAAFAQPRQGIFLDAARADDWVGVQSYTRLRLEIRDGVAVQMRPEPDAERTLTGWEYYPQALGGAVRQVAAAVGDVPIIVTENGIATADDEQRIAYMQGALHALEDAINDGIDVRGYLHWSLLDNFEWGRWEPTFGLIAVDRQTFQRTSKRSLAWLGSVARAGQLPEPSEPAVA